MVSIRLIALLLHGDAVEDVGLLHGAPAVGDDDELGLVRHLAHIAGKAHDTLASSRAASISSMTQKGVGRTFKMAKVQGNGHKGLLAAGEQEMIFSALPGAGP